MPLVCSVLSLLYFMRHDFLFQEICSWFYQENGKPLNHSHFCVFNKYNRRIRTEHGQTLFPYYVYLKGLFDFKWLFTELQSRFPIGILSYTFIWATVRKISLFVLSYLTIYLFVFTSSHSHFYKKPPSCFLLLAGIGPAHNSSWLHS